MQFSFGNTRRCRVWIDEIPDLAVVTHQVHEFEFVGAKSGHSELSQRRVAIEVFLPIGARAHYGLLGCNYTPARSGSLHVKVQAADEGPRHETSLAGVLDEVQAGIPSWAVPAVANAAATAVEMYSLSGELLFDHGAWGQIGSSAKTFALIADVLLKVCAGAIDPTEKGLQLATREAGFFSAE